MTNLEAQSLILNEADKLLRQAIRAYIGQGWEVREIIDRFEELAFDEAEEAQQEFAKPHVGGGPKKPKKVV